MTPHHRSSGNQNTVAQHAINKLLLRDYTGQSTTIAHFTVCDI